MPSSSSHDSYLSKLTPLQVESNHERSFKSINFREDVHGKPGILEQRNKWKLEVDSCRTQAENYGDPGGRPLRMSPRERSVPRRPRF